MRKIYIFIMLMCLSLGAFAQATSLEIDCQTPGWLSSMINYGDQQTVKNLKITGYINATDLTFIKELMSKQTLNGRIDLSDVNIVGATSSEDNALSTCYFGQAQHLLLPISLSSVTKCVRYARLDSLTIGGPNLPIINSSALCGYTVDDPDVANYIGYIKFREGVTEIGEKAFFKRNSSSEAKKLTEIQFPNSLRKIGDYAFNGCAGLEKINNCDSIEAIGKYAFVGTNIMRDTVKVPNNVKTFCFSSFSIANVYYIGSNVTSINNISENRYYGVNGYTYADYVGSANTMTIHCAASTPPNIITVSDAGGLSTFNSSTIYVPKGSITAYKNTSVWKSAKTILAEPNPATSISLDYNSLEIIKNNSKQLSATVFPEDADSKTVHPTNA